MSKRKSTKYCCFVLFCGAPLVAITGQVGRTAGYDHSLFLFHLSLKVALPCRVTKKDASRSIFCTFLFVLCRFYF